jgi:hypothetical protein
MVARAAARVNRELFVNFNIHLKKEVHILKTLAASKNPNGVNLVIIPD